MVKAKRSDRILLQKSRSQRWQRLICQQVEVIHRHLMVSCTYFDRSNAFKVLVSLVPSQKSKQILNSKLHVKLYY